MTKTPSFPPDSPASAPTEGESGSVIKIRSATPGDTEVLAGLWAACGLTRPWNDPAKDIAFALAGPTSDILVGSEDGRIIASVMVGHDGHRGAVYYLSADPARRGEGLGRMMMAAAEDWLKARGVWKLNLMVRSENTGVLTFYEGLGYEDGQVIVMGKWLND